MVARPQWWLAMIGNPKRRAVIVNQYRKGKSLREVGKSFGVSMQRIHKIIKTEAPQLMRKPYFNDGIQASAIREE